MSNVIRCVTKKNKNGRTAIFVKCQDCGEWGRVKRWRNTLYVNHMRKIHRINGELFEEIRRIYNQYNIRTI